LTFHSNFHFLTASRGESGENITFFSKKEFEYLN
jgi:hypothetical protein